jgi:acetylornithine deacetylase/succinyl-diaminopimelate desuccinylase-like protein
MYAMLKSKNTGVAEEVVRFARQLVGVPSPSLAEAKVAGLVRSKMNEVGYEKVFCDDFGNIVGLMMGRESEPTLLLNCHMDTVLPSKPTEAAAGDSRADNEVLRGLGAADCKGGLAAQVYAGALLRRSLLPLRGNLVVAATVAEENGCSVGIRGLLEKTLPEMGLKPHYAILGEPTDLHLYYGHDGWLEFDVRVEGANPFQVDDAAQAVYTELSRRSSGDGPTGRCDQTVRQPHFDDSKGLHRATVRVERRMAAADKADQVLAQVEHTVSLATQTAGAVAVELVVREESQRLYNGRTTVVKRVAHAWSIDPYNPLMERARQSLLAAGCEVSVGTWRLGQLGMGTAGGVLVNEFKVPTIGYGPGEETQAHTAHESVRTRRIVEAVYGTAVIAHALVGIPVCGWTVDEI